MFQLISSFRSHSFASFSIDASLDTIPFSEINNIKIEKCSAEVTDEKKKQKMFGDVRRGGGESAENCTDRNQVVWDTSQCSQFRQFIVATEGDSISYIASRFILPHFSLATSIK